jgi:aspartyl-tRNA(Asn)/glutamyl-tRNA(Gln) amidotransferase subunit A
MLRHQERYVEKALRIRRLIADDFACVFHGENRVDLLLTPVTSDTAPLYSQFTRADDGYARERTDDYFTQPANMAGTWTACFETEMYIF